MKNLSISQKYLICALSKRGGLAKKSYEVSACMLSSCMLDLLSSDIITINGNGELIVKRKLTENMRHLKPFYEFLKREGDIKYETVISKYMLLFSNKEMKKIVLSISESVEKKGYVKFHKNESFKMGSIFVPILEKRIKLVENLKKELLINENIEDESIALTGLLMKSGLENKYFSKNEMLNINWNKIERNKNYKYIEKIVDYAVSMVVVVSKAGWLLAS